MKFQIVHRAGIDFEATRENLIRLGLKPHKEKAGRKPMEEAGNLTFKLHGNSVNIFPKGKYYAIQVSWHSVEEMRKHEKKLFNVLVFPSAYAKALGRVDFENSKHMSIPSQIPFDDELLSKIDVAYSEYERENAKAFKLFR